MKKIKRKKGAPAVWGAFVQSSRGTPGDHELACYVNNVYQVSVSEAPINSTSWPYMLWLSIVRRDRGAVIPWRDMQRIKNELAGTICEAVEVYPREDRLRDECNQYHLFVLEPGLLFPFGYNGRGTSYDGTMTPVPEGFESAHQQAEPDPAYVRSGEQAPPIGRIWDLVDWLPADDGEKDHE